ncbi:MAG: PD40 domain-containing protein [Sedimentisphaerales bacterium]|nr:PD40 domain-containing protein [Sedimentisphaerales bacterium]
MKRRFIVTGILAGVLILLGVWRVFSAPKPGARCTPVAREPNIAPDYCGVTIPPNIAPLNFRILERGRAYHVKLHADRGAAIEITGRTASIRIPPRKWRALLEANRGRDIRVDVCVETADHGWQQFQRITNTVAEEEIDGTLVYRFMKPIYNAWDDIGIYQRSLADFDTSPVLHGRSFGQGCLNCHSFAGHKADTMTIGLRSATYGSHTLLARNGAVRKIGAKWGYTSWHPSGRLAVYSINKVHQFFHTGGLEVRDVVDLDSALVCYHLESGEAVSPAALADKDRLETYPTWSPDGRYLYYCSAPVLWSDRDTVPPENYDKLKYDLCRIPYDVETNQWGQAETVLAAEDTGLSILLPRISPDGRFLLFCMCRYGCFPVYQPSSDLYLMDLAGGEYRRLEANSAYSESWHSWSSNSRWIAFSSKRQGGSLTRTYFGYVDGDGRVCKPFVLPQKDPAYYDSLLETYSVPELIQTRIKVSRSRLARAARSVPSVAVDLPLTGATPQARPSDPWQERE